MRELELIARFYQSESRVSWQSPTGDTDAALHPMLGGTHHTYWALSGFPTPTPSPTQSTERVTHCPSLVHSTWGVGTPEV